MPTDEDEELTFEQAQALAKKQKEEAMSGRQKPKPVPAKKTVAKKSGKTAVRKVPDTQLFSPEETRIKELLSELYQLSPNARRVLLLKRYEKELEDYKASLGTREFNKALHDFMREKVEGKILAAFHSNDSGK